VQLQYKPHGAVEWLALGKRCRKQPHAQRWDTTVLDDGVYDIRCVALKTDEAALISDVVCVTVDNTTDNHDVVETIERRRHEKTQKITQGPVHTTMLYDGTEVAIPQSEYGIVGEWLRLTMVPPDEVAQPLKDVRNALLIPLRVYRRLDVASGATETAHDITVTIPYPDRRVSGIDESSLSVYYYDDEKRQWEDIPSVRIYPKSNRIVAMTTRIGLYSVGAASYKQRTARCFVAAAAQGAPMAREIWTLCHFRDRYLLRTRLGRRIVAFYYRHSPPVASYIYQSRTPRGMARWLLKPVIWCVKALIVWQESDYYENSTHC
jgi:hypothetical protein